MSKQTAVEHLVKFPEILGELKTTSSQDLITVNAINQVIKMSNQTAVEWLQERLLLSLSDELKSLNGFFVIAKEMEKQMIMDAHIAGMEFIAVYPNKYVEDAEQYYNETYKKEEK
jgi:hypothetical protein